MNIARFCIARPIFTLMMMSAMVVLGIFSYTQLGLDLMPKTDIPLVRIYATLAGAGPEEMETQIAKPIEEAVNTIGGIDTVTTKCLFGATQIAVKFDLEKNTDVAAQEVRDKISRITKDFPQGTDPPMVEKLDPDASPVITLIVSSKMPIKELTYFIRKRLKEPIEAINGVGAIQIVGGREREIHIILDAKRMSAYNISVGQVTDALKSQNVEIPGGNITHKNDEYVLRTLGRIRNPEDFKNLILATQGNATIHISDIGTAVDAEQEPRTMASLDGQNCVSLVVQKQSGVNTLEVIDRIKKRVDELKVNFPADMQIVPIRDQSDFIKASLHELNTHLILGSLLASFVVYLFMGNLVATLISATAIPISLISTFLLMKLMGFTLNNMSMLGLTLSVGIVIDDAIVVLENIFRHMEEKGSDSMKASGDATEEIGSAVLATSLSLAVIFVPIAFMYGVVGRFLNNFGLTIAFAILISIVVSFTLTPMLCSRLFAYRFALNKGHSKDSVLNRLMQGGYGLLLDFSLRHRWLIVLVSVLCVLSIKPVGKLLKMDFMPPDDMGEYTIYFRTDEGASIDGTLAYIKEIEEKIGKLPGVRHLFSTIGEGTGVGVNEAQIYVQLIDMKERTFSQFDSMEEARKIMKAYPTFRPAVQGVSSIGTGRQADVQFFIKGPDLDKINAFMKTIAEKARQNPNFANADSSFIDRKPEVHIQLDRERAYRMGVRLDTLAGGLRTLIGGADQISRFKEADELYEVRIRLREDDRQSIEAVSSLMFPNNSGGMIRLDSIASVSRGFGPAQIDRQDRQRSITLQANLSPSGALGDANSFLIATVKEMNLPTEYQYGLTGRSQEMGRAVRGFVVAFFMSAIFMYMILAAQFESLLHPITIMFSLPLSIPFALISLLAVGSSLNINSALGVFMLFGIVKKNAILQIDYTNTLRNQGLDRPVAVREANLARLRPILMTTITLVAGMLPMALGKGAGAATRAPMAIVVIGGQSLCLLITLLLTPVAYTLFDDAVVWLGRILPAPAKAVPAEPAEETKSSLSPSV